MNADDKPELQPGDCLLYRPRDLLGWVIAVKTWCRAAVHVEVYAGGGVSFAARSSGVNLYALRWDGLSRVLRPAAALDLAAARSWFYARAQGQKYDWKGLLCFTLAVRQGSQDRMFCSELETRLYRSGGFKFVSDCTDADKVPPAQSLWSPMFNLIWSDGRE